ncbi:hypothetical protein BDBG_16734 [Blastomyces gilchristii SLH14081]|uniref:Uncharacterized protein n=1 Tax=Blastomyces gilchristii (strain SLH14081) TaxID=559298 RepID=A0A179UIL1_BLAGS|nr:uncharacterized protein BDBG_16734 [Blastomyces gilchristii SLH14081]OAT06871.1 hypothetical protein BDBG_16734 [Blastomyces gilchristii SLH14081]
MGGTMDILEILNPSASLFFFLSKSLVRDLAGAKLPISFLHITFFLVLLSTPLKKGHRMGDARAIPLTYGSHGKWRCSWELFIGYR